MDQAAASDGAPDEHAAPVIALLETYKPADDQEAAEVAGLLELARTSPDPWSRATDLHFTASALIVHIPSARVLLRWHQRQQDWLQVGGHGDPGESDPLAIAMREAEEETGLTDLRPWPDPVLQHVVIVQVPAGRGEPAHKHADLRFVLATDRPEDATAETPDAPVRWLSLPAAERETGNANLRITLTRVAGLLAGH